MSYSPRSVGASLADLFFLVAAVVVPTGPALAAEGGGGWGRVIYHAINLVVLVGVLVHFGKKPLLRFLRGRADTVGKDIDDAARQHATALAKLEEYEARLEQLRREADEIVAEFRREGEAERARLIAEAQAEAERLRRDAERAAQSEISRARARLEGELVDLAIAKATELLQQKTTPADQRRLAAEYLTRLEERS